jgi:hypothetical protein
MSLAFRLAPAPSYEERLLELLHTCARGGARSTMLCSKTGNILYGSLLFVLVGSNVRGSG